MSSQSRVVLVVQHTALVVSPLVAAGFLLFLLNEPIMAITNIAIAGVMVIVVSLWLWNWR